MPFPEQSNTPPNDLSSWIPAVPHTPHVFPGGLYPTEQDEHDYVVRKIAAGVAFLAENIGDPGTGTSLPVPLLPQPQPSPVWRNVVAGEVFNFDCYGYAVTSKGCQINGQPIPAGVTVSANVQPGKKFAGIQITGPAWVFYEPI